MSIRRIDIMTGVEIRKLLDRTVYHNTCRYCPLQNNGNACSAENFSCEESILDYLYEDVEDDTTINSTIKMLSSIAASIHSLIVDCTRLSGNVVSSGEFAQMIADRLTAEEHSNDC